MQAKLVLESWHHYLSEKYENNLNWLLSDMTPKYPSVQLTS